jgi:hypothetical protein
MLIFIDTEFTDFQDTELISIGLITEDLSKQFYAELPIPVEKCSDFVVEHVLSQLGHDNNAKCSAEELRQRLNEWIGQFENQEGITVCFDSERDWILFQKSLGGRTPTWITPRNIYNELDMQIVERFYTDHNMLEHHALHDAQANLYAYVKPHVGKTPPA